VLSSTYAYAVDDNVRQACRGDYYQHCSQFSVGTEELRKCMRTVGESLSTPCLVALVQAGEITQADVERHNAAKAGKNPTKTAAASDDDTKATVDPKDVSSKSIKNRKAKASAVGDAGKTGKLPKKIAASSKAKPGNKTKAKTAAAAGNAGKSVSAVSGNKNKKATKSKKTAKKLSSSKPSAGKTSATKPAATNTVASKKVKKVPVSQVP